MDIVEKITGIGFELDNYAVGKHECTCPFCSHTRKPIHQKQKCAAVWIEEDFATYNCVHCGEHGFLNADKPSKNQPYTRPNIPKHTDDNLILAAAFFESRGIKLETARKFGLYVEKDKFRVPVLAFPFYKGGQLVNVKYRGLAEKSFAQEKNPEPVVFGYDKCFGQKEIIVVEGECFTGDTQVLTERGWVDFSDYHGQRVVQVNKNLTAELVEPIAVIKKPYSGDLLARKTKNMDLLATPGHNIVYVSARKGVCKRKFCEMPRAIEGAIPTAVKFNSKNQIPLLDDELRLWVAISADGSIDRDSTTGHIRAAFKKKRKIDRFEQLLVSCKLNYTKAKQRNGYTYFGFCWTNVTKVFPMEWLFFMSTHQRDVLLKELIFWDGNTVPNRSMTEYSTKLYENAVFVQTLCHLSGFNSSIVYRHNEHGNWFKVTMLWDKSHVSWQFKNQPEHKNYDGTVYCVQVPSGMILVRRNEKIMVVGNCDVLAFAEVGIENVVSIPSGSIGQPVDKDYKGAKFDFLKVSQPLFDIADRVILALDSDAPGQYMTQALIDRLGKEKCWLVDWSAYKVKGKDANDFLLIDKSILPDAIASAKPVPLRGIVNAGDDMDAFEDYIREGINGAITTGFDNLDELIKFEYGNFVTVTGYPGSGKSLFATDLIMNLAELHNIKTLYCAFENNPNQLKKKWLQMKVGHPVMNADEETVKEIREHYQFLKDHFFILQDYTTSLTVDEILDMAQQAIRRYNIGCVIIDPLNKLTFNKSSNFTEDIGELLTKLIIFAKRNGILMFLVAHPTKPSDGQRKLGAQSTPSGFDIAGSANFLNMSDVIMTIHRKQDEFGNKSQNVRVLISKVRDTDFGHEGSCYFMYNPASGRYFPTTATDFENENLDPVIRTKEWLTDI